MENKVTDSLYEAKYFAKLRKDVLQDLTKHADECNFFLKKYKREEIEKALLTPDKPQSEKILRAVSRFYYAVSPHYRRAIAFFAGLPTNNYVLRPIINPYENFNLEHLKKQYVDTAIKYEKYRFKNENSKILTTCFLDGVFYGITFENKESYILKPIPADFAVITSEEDGVFRFSFDLNYFTKSRLDNLKQYGSDFVRAYKAYRGCKEENISPNSKLRWFEPKNQICIKFDEEVTYSVSPFIGIFNCIISLETYDEIKKDKAMLDNFRLIHYQIPTDSDGVPRMSFEDARRYYDLTAANIPEGVGLAMSPFKADNFTLKNTKDDGDYVSEATKDLFANFGLNPLLFGMGDNPTSQTLELSVRSDEAIVFKLLRQIANAINVQFKKNKTKEDYMIYLTFLEQSIFNKDKVTESYAKPSQYSYPTRLYYLASLGFNPLDIVGQTKLENDIFNITVDTCNRPIISSNTISGGTLGDNEIGRPTTDTPSENTEKNADNNGTYK